MNNKTRLNREYGKFFGKENWDYFSTLTYKFPVKIGRNRVEMTKLFNNIKKQSIKFSLIWVSEYHQSFTSIHSHILSKGADISLIDKYWYQNSLGYRNDHKIYDKDKGANFYLAKYIDKGIDYDIFGI